MTNEIKEILKYLKDDSIFIYDEDGTRKEITLDESKLLLDYITKLQNEIFDLKDTIQNKNDCIGAYECIIEDRDKRIDKAVEYIINHTQSTAHLEIDAKSIKQLLDILRGDE